MDLRSIATGLFLQALKHVTVAEAVRARVHTDGEKLRIGELSYALNEFRRVIVVAVGKAAVPMCGAILSTIEPSLLRRQLVEAVIVGSTTPDWHDPRVRFFRGGHPLPNAASREAAEYILHLLKSCDETCLVLFLISGGASAMIEFPIDPNKTTEEVSAFFGALVNSGLPIVAMNALRSHFSRVKGGRLAVAARGSTQCTLLISDVPHNLLHVVGSGPSLPDPSTTEDCREILRARAKELNLPKNLVNFFADPELEETIKANDLAFEKSECRSLLSSEDLCAVAREAAMQFGFEVVVDHQCDDWGYREAAAYLLGRLQELRKHHPRVCLLSAGEIAVQLPKHYGIGGRNQQFTLECARLLPTLGLEATVLSGGSDGIDGNSPAAGAVCDETTVARAGDMGLNVVEALDGFASYELFERLGDAIVTGLTETNVRDLRILLSSA